MNWDLGKLYAGFDDPAFAQDEQALTACLERVENVLVSGKEAVETLCTALKALLEASETMGAYGSYIFLTLSADATNEAALKNRDKMMRIGMRMSQTGSALSRYLGGLQNLDSIISADPLLQEHAFMLREMQQEALHTINPALEGVVLEMQMNGGNAFSNLRDQLDAGHMVPYNGGKLPLSAIRNLAYEADPAVRKAAYEAELAAYPAIETPMAACLNAIKGEALTLCRLKKYDSVLDMTLAESRMDKETLDVMIAVMQESLPHFRRFLRAKARHLGHENGLPFYDLFAPLGDSSAKYSLEEARQMLVSELGAFSPQMGRMIERAFDENWIDAYPREGKQGGAFCADSYRTKTSYVLTNYDGSLSDVDTLAHELGHAFHNECLYNRSALNCGTPMPLAETASTFNEIVFVQSMMKKADKNARLQLLDQQLTDATQVIVDILSRYLFETEVVARRATQEMTARELCQIMTEAQRKTYGDGLDPRYMHPYMWACKSHYYSTGRHFYNFPYAFGMLFGYGVYACYQKEGAAYEEKYKTLLSLSGMMKIYDVAMSAGIDLHDPQFWRNSMAGIVAKIDEFEELIS